MPQDFCNYIPGISHLLEAFTICNCLICDQPVSVCICLWCRCPAGISLRSHLLFAWQARKSPACGFLPPFQTLKGFQCWRPQSAYPFAQSLLESFSLMACREPANLFTNMLFQAKQHGQRVTRVVRVRGSPVSHLGMLVVHTNAPYRQNMIATGYCIGSHSSSSKSFKLQEFVVCFRLFWPHYSYNHES